MITAQRNFQANAQMISTADQVTQTIINIRWSADALTDDAMDRLLYVAMTGAKQLMQAQTLVAHNLANVSTTGFRADLARFEAAPVEGPGYPSRINTVAAGSVSTTRRARCIRPARRSTSRSKAPGWIAVQAKDGTEAYHAQREHERERARAAETDRGELVLGDNGPVAMPPNTSVSLAKDGTISVVPEGQGPETLAQVGRIKLVNPDASSSRSGRTGSCAAPAAASRWKPMRRFARVGRHRERAT